MSPQPGAILPNATLTQSVTSTPASPTLPIHPTHTTVDPSIGAPKAWLDATRLVAAVFKSGRSYLESQGFVEVMTPHLVRASGACENVNTLFEVAVDEDTKWFNGRRAYLSQTGQLYLEALVPTLGKVYCSGPSFRAEPIADARHLVEFQMMEIEFPGSFDDLLGYINGFVYAIAQDIANAQDPATLGLIAADIERLKACPKVFDRITYDEAIEELQKLGNRIEWGDDISSALERILIQHHGNAPVFITRYPDPMVDFGKHIEVEKFFNMLPDPENPGRVLSSDLILPFSGESVGSAARVHDADQMQARLLNSRMYKRLLEKGGDIKDFEWYLSRIRAGSVPHAGCGFGMSRIIQWVRGSENVMDGTTFPLNRETLI
ncbi:hypothetical protein HZA86_04935 [Candidatus Uhrbacteria bacterium]|nr:hypothetical protein [Candidatus Uhrbacteria bacterium]